MKENRGIEINGIRKLENGLTEDYIVRRFPWLLKAKFKDAVIGLDEDEGLAWYDGIWEKGTWKKW